MSNSPHWRVVLVDLWERADGKTFEPVSVPDYCEEEGYDEGDVLRVLEVWAAQDYIECGVSMRYPWFCSAPEWIVDPPYP